MTLPGFPNASIWLNQEPPCTEPHKLKGITDALEILGPNPHWLKAHAPADHFPEGHLGTRFRRWELWVLGERFHYAKELEYKAHALPGGSDREVWAARQRIFMGMQKHVTGLLGLLEKISSQSWEASLLKQIAPFSPEDMTKNLGWLAKYARHESSAMGDRKRDLLTHIGGTPEERLVWDLRIMWEGVRAEKPAWSGDFKRLVDALSKVIGVSIPSRQGLRILAIPKGTAGPLPLCEDVSGWLANGYTGWRIPDKKTGNRE